MKRVATAVCLAALCAALPAWASLPAARSMKGYLSQRSGDYASALDHYKAALREDPDSVELRLRLVRLHSVFGDLEQALRVLAEGLEKTPAQSALLLSKARTLMMMKRNPEAAEAAEAAAKNGAGTQAFELGLRLLDGMSRDADALALAEAWVAEEPSNPDAASQHAFLLDKAGKADEAEKEYRRALGLKADHTPTLSFLARLLARRGDREGAVRLFESSIAANPHDAEARLSLAGLYYEAGQPEKVKETLAETRRWVKGPPLLLLRMGLLYLEIGEPESALEVIDAIAEDERDERAWFFLGAARLGLDRFDQALEAFGRISPGSSLYPETLLRRSQALQLAGRGEEAVTLLKTRLAETKGDIDTSLALASLFSTLNRHAEVIELLLPLAEKGETKDARLFFALGVAYDKTGEWEKCVASLHRVIEIDPRHAHALNYLGYLYAERGVHLDEAEGLVKRAIELLPRNGFILDSLGWVYYKQKRYAEAKDTLEASVALSPDDPVIWEHLGDVLVEMGDVAGARKAYENSLIHKSDAEGPKKKLKELESR